jgi:hypothetical protein
MWKIMILALLTACSTTPKTCEQLAWEASGQAMSNTQYNLERQQDWNKQVNCANGCLNTPLLDTVDTGQANGPASTTNYKGLSSREAYDKVMLTCGK